MQDNIFGFPEYLIFLEHFHERWTQAQIKISSHEMKKIILKMHQSLDVLSLKEKLNTENSELDQAYFFVQFWDR